MSVNGGKLHVHSSLVSFISMPHILGNNLDFLEPSPKSGGYYCSKVERDVAQIDSNSEVTTTAFRRIGHIMNGYMLVTG